MTNKNGQKVMQWAVYTERIEKLPSVALRFICNDAQEAINAMPDGINAGYYGDEILICSDELHKRSKMLVNREEKYVRVLADMFLLLKEAGYNSYEMIDDLRDLVNDSQRPATEEAEVNDYKAKHNELVEAILLWANTSHNHGGNPFRHDFMKLVPWKNRR